MIVAFTGAGISKESGIDTFQDRPGIRDKLTRDFANKHSEEYRQVMSDFLDMVEGKEPNDAHLALAYYNIPVITMNVDGLHRKARSKHLLELHGRLPKREELSFCETLRRAPVLYGDEAPAYAKGYEWLSYLGPGDIFLVIGASDFTSISGQYKDMVRYQGAKIYEIQEMASKNVRRFLEEHINNLGSFKVIDKVFD